MTLADDLRSHTYAARKRIKQESLHKEEKQKAAAVAFAQEQYVGIRNNMMLGAARGEWSYTYALTLDNRGTLARDGGDYLDLFFAELKRLGAREGVSSQQVMFSMRFDWSDIPPNLDDSTNFNDPL